MKRFRIFRGVFGAIDADEKINEWLDENPDVKIIDYKFNLSTYGNHAICVLYRENNNVYVEVSHGESIFDY